MHNTVSGTESADFIPEHFEIRELAVHNETGQLASWPMVDWLIHQLVCIQVEKENHLTVLLSID